MSLEVPYSWPDAIVRRQSLPQLTNRRRSHPAGDSPTARQRPRRRMMIDARSACLMLLSHRSIDRALRAEAIGLRIGQPIDIECGIVFYNRASSFEERAKSVTSMLEHDPRVTSSTMEGFQLSKRTEGRNARALRAAWSTCSMRAPHSNKQSAFAA